MNLFVGFRARIAVERCDRVLLRVTASSVYRAFVNGVFAGYGPARAAHGFYRVDEWDISSLLPPGENWIAIEVAGYNVNSYYLLDQPAFLQAEVVRDGIVRASTAGEGAAFEAAVLPWRVQKVQRYSFQRPFTEAYRLRRGCNGWRTGSPDGFDAVECSVTETKTLLPRGIPLPDVTVRVPQKALCRGTVKTGIAVKDYWRDRSLTDVGTKLKGYSEAELDTAPALMLQTIANETVHPIEQPGHPPGRMMLDAQSFCLVDFGINLSGFIGATVTCTTRTRLFLLFDEILVGGDVDWKRLSCVNVLAYELEPGTYELESFEPYTLRYLKVIVLDGACEVRDVSLREYAAAGMDRATFACSHPDVMRIFDAARATCRQNATDVFMDCPSRERAGWLCDSFFTARVACEFTGSAAIERNFLENFLLPARFEHLPDGMLPMCYPADHPDGNFIPQWALWFVVQLEEYLERSGDRALVDALRPRVMNLFAYFPQFVNEDGLLERLDAWNFLEWSKANAFTRDVNYPTNMLYAGALAAAGRIYGDQALRDASRAVLDTVRAQSFDGAFFVDNAVRKDGRLERTDNRTEACQYYAFFFGAATPETHPALWRVLLHDFGPRRREHDAFPAVHVANAFVGNYLRLEMLSRHGAGGQAVAEVKGYFLGMAEQTGTLWEHDRPAASCNHGFASHVAHVLYRDALGIAGIDRTRRRIALRLGDTPLEWCEGRVPAGEGAVHVAWRRVGGEVRYRVDVPAGFALSVSTVDGVSAVREW
ncbi:hypothetical protein GX586_07980 [bacterium]|nr:hypothetical protein [bacterium]